MVKSCAAYKCLAKFVLGSDISFHRFPKDQELCKKWVLSMGRKDFIPNDYNFLCSQHFKKEDFERTFPTKVLKNNAVPSIFDINLPQKNKGKGRLNKKSIKRVGPQIQPVDDAQPQLIVLLDNNYGLPGSNNSVRMVEGDVTKINTSVNLSNGNVKCSDINSLNNLTKTAINGTNNPQIICSSPIENSNLRSVATTLTQMINANASKILSIKQYALGEKRCRSCLTGDSSTYKKITSPCYLDKTIKDAIFRLVPEIKIPIQDTDVVCGKCFEILRESLEFAFMFTRSEIILKKELQNKQKEALNGSIPLNIAPKYTPLRDNFTLDVADKVISLSKIDNNNLTKFVDTLQLNQVKIFQYETNPYARKRVLLLGNPKLRRCYVCYAKFLSESQLQDHLNSDHQITKEYLVKPIRHITASEEEPLTCRACNKNFLSEFNLKSHLKWCISFPCPHCEDHKTFACDKLVEHTRTAHGDEFPFKCCKCKKEFDDYQMYVKHNCTGHTCNTCGKKFTSTIALTYHIDKHKDVPCNVPFKNCPVCKEIVRTQEYSLHLLAHKKFVCSMCGMRFYKNETLEEHEKTHVKGLKTHKCDTCGKLFLKAETLHKHQKTHQLPKVEETCEICSETFNNVKSLKQHIMNIHGDPLVACELCGKECRPERLKQHIEMKHSSKPKHQCPLCSKSFVQLIQYKKHMDEHTNGKNYPKPQIKKPTEEAHEENVKEEFAENFHESESVTDHFGQDCIEDSVSSAKTEGINKGKITNSEENGNRLKRVYEESNQDGSPFKRKKMFNFDVNVSNGPVVCKYCLKSFSSQKSLRLHIQCHFQTKKSEKCCHCDLTFPNKVSRIKHERSHTEVPSYKFRCNICWRIMLNEEELHNHIMSHNNTLTCEKCGEKFARQWQLDGHYSSHHKEHLG